MESDNTSKMAGTPEERRRKYGRQTHWRLVNGRWEPPELQLRYLMEWCMSWPRPYDSKEEWAQRNGVTARTLNNWENDERFVALWKDLSDKRFTHPDFLNPLVANMQAIATAPMDDKTIDPKDRMKATEILVRMMERMSPPPKHRDEPVMDEDLALVDEADLMEVIEGADSTANYTQEEEGRQDSTRASEGPSGDGALYDYESDGDPAGDGPSDEEWLEGSDDAPWGSG